MNPDNPLITRLSTDPWILSHLKQNKITDLLKINIFSFLKTYVICSSFNLKSNGPSNSTGSNWWKSSSISLPRRGSKPVKEVKTVNIHFLLGIKYPPLMKLKFLLNTCASRLSDEKTNNKESVPLHIATEQISMSKIVKFRINWPRQSSVSPGFIVRTFSRLSGSSILMGRVTTVHVLNNTDTYHPNKIRTGVEFRICLYCFFPKSTHSICSSYYIVFMSLKSNVHMYIYL